LGGDHRDKNGIIVTIWHHYLARQRNGMASKASTHRLDPEVQAALNHLSKVLHRPKNRLMNEAIKLYVWQRSREVEHELETTLQALRAYRQKDPDFEKAIGAFVNVEAQLAGEDPLEGRSPSAGGLVQTEIRNLLHA
jgi:predicted DNA-binding protein